MRISDWSSDVCSSDLIVELLQPQLQALDGEFLVIDQNGADCHAFDPIFCSPPADLTRAGKVVCVAAVPAWFSALPARSEEHTSELQSLMRISYAVFCLKQKNKKI